MIRLITKLIRIVTHVILEHAKNSIRILKDHGTGPRKLVGRE